MVLQVWIIGPFCNDIICLLALDLLHCSRPLINRSGNMLKKGRQIQNMFCVIETVAIVNAVKPTKKKSPQCLSDILRKSCSFFSFFPRSTLLLRSPLVGTCNFPIFLTRRFHRPIYLQRIQIGLAGTSVTNHMHGLNF